MRLFVLAALAALSATGCKGSVKPEDLDSFGTVWSSVWVHAEADEEESDYILLSSTMGICGKLRKAYEELNPLLDDWISQANDGDLEGYCADGEDVLTEVADYAGALTKAGSHPITFALYNVDDDSFEPEEETYEVGDDEWYLSASVSYYEDNLWEIYLDTWDEDDCLETGYGFDEDDLDDAVDSWYFEDGELEVTKLTDSKIKGTFEGELADEDGDSDGDIEGKFSASLCEIEVDEDYLWF